MESLTVLEQRASQVDVVEGRPDVALGSTALESFMRPVESYVEVCATDQPQLMPPLRATPTQQRTFDQIQNHPDTVPDISQE